MHPSHGHDQTIVNGISRIGYMTGGKAALWNDEDMADVFTRQGRRVHRAAQGASRSSSSSRSHDIHVPRVPHPRFVGKTGMGPRGDVIVQADWCVGEILATLDRLKLADNTLVIFTSDNGPVVDDGYQDEAVAKLGGHTPAGPFRGGKYSNFEGGTRVPFIVRWPGAREAGRVGRARLPGRSPARRSPRWLDRTAGGRPMRPTASTSWPRSSARRKPAARTLVEQAGGLALRLGPWKYIEPSKRPKMNVQTNTELGNDTVPQLYNLREDPGERRTSPRSIPRSSRR